MINLYLEHKRIELILRKPLILVCGLLLIVGQLSAQDVHFTQFDYNPIFLNPANVGNFIGDWRVAGTFRNQWQGTATPFRTATVSADKPIYLMGQKIGAGFLFLNDAAGPGKMTYNRLYATAGYGYELSNNYLRGGLQVGYVMGSINDWNIWNHSDGDYTTPSGEADLVGTTGYLDVNLGLSWKRNIKIFEPEAGLNILHVNVPNQSFTGGKKRVPIGLSFYTTIKTNISDKIFFTPKVYYGTAKSVAVTILGIDGGYNLLGNRSSVKRIFGGVYARNGIFDELDSFMAQIGTTVGRLDIALSYDAGLSSLGQSRTMSSFEISFVYKSISTVLNSYSIPCERY